MFLVVFVTLVISIIGLYAQILGLQSAKIYNAQNGLAQTMITWHGAAVDLVKASIAAGTFQAPAAGSWCQLTDSTAALTLNTVCTTTTGATMTLTTGAVASVLSAFSMGSTLPIGYSVVNGAGYKFYSILYVSGGNDYVMTFAHDTKGGNLILPAANAVGATTVGYSPYNLSRQLAHLKLSNQAYGSVTDNVGTLSVPSYTIGFAGPNLTYSIPQNPSTIPLGSIALLTSAN